jgi:ABC-three component (ABC-3C) system Middle Component 7
LITPNKVLSLDESALGRLAVIMRQSEKSTDLVVLYRAVADQFESVDQFLFALDILFVVGRIDVNLATRAVTYAD